jgi:hypothetical protein
MTGAIQMEKSFDEMNGRMSFYDVRKKITTIHPTESSAFASEAVPVIRLCRDREEKLEKRDPIA